MSIQRVLLFPGQGSQYRGMGKKLFPKYAALTKKASAILGYDIEKLFDNPQRLTASSYISSSRPKEISDPQNKSFSG